MNYKDSQIVLEEIQKVERVLLNCHRGPDPDAIGPALAMKMVLENMGKKVDIICPSEELYENVTYLKDFDTIRKGIDFRKFNFQDYDLFITLDSGDWSQVTGFKEFEYQGPKLIVIDHHLTNDKYGDINFVDNKVGSMGELLYLIFEDWGVTLNKDIADCLMAGIVGDTGAFRYPAANEQTFRIAVDLMKLGADKDLAVHKLYRSEPYEQIKFYGEVLTRVEIDAQRRFIWSAIPYDVYERLGKPPMAKESAASLFTQIVEGTDFGFVALEQERNRLSISFRSRTGFDTSKLAKALGGGGHVYASGGRIENTPFDEAVNKLLEIVRKAVDENKEGSE